MASVFGTDWTRYGFQKNMEPTLASSEYHRLQAKTLLQLAQQTTDPIEADRLKRLAEDHQRRSLTGEEKGKSADR